MTSDPTQNDDGSIPSVPSEQTATPTSLEGAPSGDALASTRGRPRARSLATGRSLLASARSPSGSTEGGCECEEAAGNGGNVRREQGEEKKEVEVEKGGGGGGDFWDWAIEAEKGPATTWPLGEVLVARHDLQHSRIFNS